MQKSDQKKLSHSFVYWQTCIICEILFKLKFNVLPIYWMFLVSSRTRDKWICLFGKDKQQHQLRTLNFKQTQKFEIWEGNLNNHENLNSHEYWFSRFCFDFEDFILLFRSNLKWNYIINADDSHISFWRTLNFRVCFK